MAPPSANGEAVAALEAVDGERRKLYSDSLAPLVDRLRTAMEVASQAEKEDHRLSERVGNRSELYAETWDRHPRLLGLLQALRGHQEHNLGSVQATERDPRNRKLEVY